MARSCIVHFSIAACVREEIPTLSFLIDKALYSQVG
jgi:hypothetical protein